MAKVRQYNAMIDQYEYIQVPDTDNKPPNDWVIDALKDSAIDPTINIEKPPTLFSIMDVQAMQFVERRVFTLGNFSAIIGRAKSKKTYLMSAISAAIISQRTLWKKFKGHASDKNMVLYFDTEQGDYDAWNVVRRICTLAGGVNAEKFKAWNLRRFKPVERCQIIEFALNMYKDQISFIVIDGIADLANAINDEDEATRVVGLLLRWTKDYNCHIATIIHQNKNDNYATGHLGSSIMKKCEIIISVEKDTKDYSKSYVKCDMSRAMDFKDFELHIDFNGLPVIDDVTEDYDNEIFDFEKVNDIVPF